MTDVPTSNLQVQRYRCVTRHGDMGDTSAEMKPDPNGAYVLYVDYERAKFAPLGDNHHNANACPYCRGAVETSGEYLTRTYWSPDRKLLVTAHVTNGEIVTLQDDNGKEWEPTGTTIRMVDVPRPAVKTPAPRCLAMRDEFGTHICSLPQSHAGVHVWGRAAAQCPPHKWNKHGWCDQCSTVRTPGNAASGTRE